MVGLRLMRFANQTKGSIAISITFLLCGLVFSLSTITPIGGMYFGIVAMFISVLPTTPMSTDLCRMSYRRRAVMTKVRSFITLISNIVMGILFAAAICLNIILNPENLDGMIVSSSVALQVITAAVTFFGLGVGIIVSEKRIVGLIIVIVVMCAALVGGTMCLHWNLIPPMHIGWLAVILFGSILLAFVLEYILACVFYNKDDVYNKTRTLSESGALLK